MNMKRFVYILIGIVLIAFGVGALSLRYNDNLKFRNLNSSNRIINIGNNKGVNIDSRGLEVMDGDNYVSISWDGIKVTDGDEKVSIGWDGIKVDDGNKTKVNIGKNNWFNFRDELEWFTFDEEKFIEINNEENINILSAFVDMEIISEDRKDIKIAYKGNMKANIEPQLNINKKIDEIEIKLENQTTSNYTVTDSDIILKVFIPKNYNESIKATGSSSDIYIEDFTLKKLDLASSSGYITINNIKGNNINLNSSSGDIQIDDSIGIMDIQSSSGKVKLDNKKNNNDITISTTSGDTYINFAKDASYTINGKTTSGSFRNRFNMTLEKGITNNRDFKGKIGNGENYMEIKTSSGNIDLSME